MKGFLVLLQFIILSFAWSQEFVVDTFYINGCKRTKPEFICRFLDVEQGATYDSVNLAHDIQKIKNLRFFKEFKINIDTNELGLVVGFQLDEILTTLPFFTYAATEINYKLRMGFNKFNLFGRGASMGMKYMRYDKNTFWGYLNVPYVSTSNVGFRTEGGLWSTLEPFKMNDESTY